MGLGEGVRIQTCNLYVEKGQGTAGRQATSTLSHRRPNGTHSWHQPFASPPLRLWESVGLVTPARSSGRFRLYTPELLDVLKRIKYLHDVIPKQPDRIVSRITFQCDLLLSA